MQELFIFGYFVNLLEPVSPFLLYFIKRQKRGKIVFDWFSYGLFFVTSNASTMPTTAIATIIPAIPGNMYASAMD